MSLSVHEKHALRSLENRLSGSDPGLASRLAMFTQLTAGEDMPAREKIQTGWRRAIRRSRGSRWRPLRGMARRWPARVTRQGVGLVLAFVLAFALLAGAATLSGGGHGRRCPPPGTTCAWPMPGHPAWLARAFAVK